VNIVFVGGESETIIVPKTGLLGKDSYEFLRESGATETDIRPRSALQVPFRVNEHDTICWEFAVKTHDVEFSVRFRTQGDGGATEEVVVEKSRFNNGKCEVNSWTATASGVAVLFWDNSFSWTKGKIVAYKASVAKIPNETSSVDISGHGSL